jgi:hypothetical protein
MNEIERVVEFNPENKKENRSSRIRKDNSQQSSGSLSDRVMFFQRTIGNQAVENMIRSGTLQAKLRIGQNGDNYEQEADRVAEAVVKMPEPKAVSGGIPHIQRACLACEEHDLKRQQIKEEEEGKLQRKTKEEEEEGKLQRKTKEEEEEGKLQRKTKQEEEEEKLRKKPNEGNEELQAKAGGSFEISHNIESQIQSLKGGGQPLSENSRAFFEPRLGHDFGHVRVHTDTQAAKLAESVNAQAFTVGKDVVFNAGQYAPEKTNGRKLLAHELTHVVQQG